MTDPLPFEVEFPEAGATLVALYASKDKRIFDAPWLHFFINGGFNNLPYGGNR